MSTFLGSGQYLGTNRYYDRSWCMFGDELIKLDATVYLIRRYCRPIKGLEQQGGPSEKEIKAFLDNGGHFSSDGFLAKCLQKNSLYYDVLTKENFYFPEISKIDPQLYKGTSANHMLARIRGEDEELFVKLAEYLLKNIRFEKREGEALEKEIKSLRDKKL